VVDDRSSQTWSNSEAYEAIMGRWSRPAAQAALEWLALPPDLAWLDVGCGTGALTRAILETAGPREVLGVDPSAEFLALAAENIRDPRVHFAIGNAQSLPAENNSFDVAISGLVLHFVADAPAAAVEMTRAVRQGGTVAGYIWDVDDDQQFTRPFWKAAAEIDPAITAWDPRTQFSLLGGEMMMGLWADAGLQDVAVAAIAIPTVFRDFDDYWQPCLLDGTTPIQRYARSLGSDQQIALRERLRTVLPIAADGSITLLGRLLISRGVK
jgi:SAM-dependent methyltransferase